MFFHPFLKIKHDEFTPTNPLKLNSCVQQSSMNTSSLVWLPLNIKAVKSIPSSSLKYCNRDLTKKIEFSCTWDCITTRHNCVNTKAFTEINAVAPAPTRVDIKSYVFWDCIITVSPKTELYLR